MAQNYYQILGVSRKATTEEIQAAFRKLVSEVYPGVNRGEAEATARMKEINRAYETLRNPDKRREYDEILSPGASKPKPQPTTRTKSGGNTAAPSSSNTFMDAFNVMSDQARTNLTGRPEAQSSGTSSGPVIQIWLTPREALDGTEKKIKVDGKLIRLKIGIRR